MNVYVEKKHLPNKIKDINASSWTYSEESTRLSLEIPESVLSVSLQGSGYQQGNPVSCKLPSQLEVLEISGYNQI